MCYKNTYKKRQKKFKSGVTSSRLKKTKKILTKTRVIKLINTTEKTASIFSVGINKTSH